MGAAVPLSRYDKFFSGKSGSATKAKGAMAKTYGAEKGEKIFYATKNRNKKSGAGKSSSKRSR
jgi:hypothetical protein